MGKEYIEAVFCHPAYLNYMPPQKKLYARYIMQNAGLEESQVGNKVSGRNINSIRYEDDTILMAENEEELKSPLRGQKRGVKKLA